MKKYYYSIGEVCNLLELKPYVIRYWETEFRQLKPYRTSGKSRRYSPEQIEVLKTIKDLLYVQKFSIKGVKNKLAQMNYNEKFNHPHPERVINPELKQELVAELTKLKSILEEQDNLETTSD
jgi:DNA-binding transcriptional MerR regulator